MAKRLALITGANRGIGFEVARQLARNDFAVLLGARDAVKGAEAARELADAGFDVHPIALDVVNPDSIEQARQFVTEQFGGLDVLVNNAGAFADWRETASGADLSGARSTMETNLFGAWQVTQAFLPLLRKSPSARIVNVSSGAGSHADMQFGLTIGKGGTASYGVSKAALNALTTKFAAELDGTGILVNATCPGLTATAEGMEAMGARPVSDGAASIVWAALLPDDGPSGGFFRDGEVLGW